MGQGTCLSAQKCCFTWTCHFWAMPAANYAAIALFSPPSTEDGIAHTTYLQADLQFTQPAPSVLYLFKSHFLKRSPCCNVTYSEKLSLAPLQNTPIPTSLTSHPCVVQGFSSHFLLLHLFPSLLPDIFPRISAPTGQRPGLSYHCSLASRMPDYMLMISTKLEKIKE